MEYGDDLEPVPADSVRDHILSAGNDQLAGSCDTARTPNVRLVCRQLHSIENSASDSSGGSGVLLRDKVADGDEMADGPAGPDDLHRGAFPSAGLRQLRSHLAAFSWLTVWHRLRSSSPCWI